MTVHRLLIGVCLVCAASELASVARADGGVRTGEGGAVVGAAQAAPQVVVSFAPLQDFAERIAGGRVRVETVTPDDADPIEWRPGAESIARLQKADLIVVNGAGYERWVATASLPLSRLCDTSRVFEKEFLKHASVTHSHGPQGMHAHEGVDGHTWLDPVNAHRQAEQVLKAMIRRWPEHERVFAEGFRGLSADLKALDERLKAMGPALRGVRVIAGHPAYNYLGKRYGWSLANVDLPPEEAPTPERIGELRAEVQRAAAGGSSRVILLTESPFEPAMSKALAAMPDVAVVLYEPGESIDHERRTKGEDFLSIMRANVDRLAKALQAAPAGADAATGRPGQP